MQIVLGADHRGFPLKQQLLNWLQTEGYEVRDIGTHSAESVDFPDYALPVGQVVAADPEHHRGIVICGSGAGVCMAANKVQGVRAAYAPDAAYAVDARTHNDINILALGADRTNFAAAQPIVQAFLTTPFDGAARRVQRINKLATFEQHA